MKAIVIKQHGGPEVLAIEERSIPVAKIGQVLIEVKAFGINQAEIYFRQGAWGDVAEISGIECVGVVKADPSGKPIVWSNRAGEWQDRDTSLGRISCCGRRGSSMLCCHLREKKASG